MKEEQFQKQVVDLREERDTLISGNALLRTENENLSSEKKILLESCAQIIDDKNKASSALEKAEKTIDNMYSVVIERITEANNELVEVTNRLATMKAQESALIESIKSKSQEYQFVASATDSLMSTARSIEIVAKEFEKSFYNLIKKAETLPFEVKEWIGQYHDIMVCQKNINDKKSSENLAKEHNLIARESFARRKEKEIQDTISEINKTDKLENDNN